MPVVMIEKEWFVSDIQDFLEKFGLTEQFLKDEGLESLAEWDYPLSDEDVILRYLEKMPEPFVVFADFDDHGEGDFWIAQIKTTDVEIMGKTVKDYIYCEDCKEFVDLWRYDHSIKATGHEGHRWRYVTEQELAQCVEDCKRFGCFKEQ